MIGRLGPEALAASTLGLALQNLFLLFGIGVTASVAPLIARAIGGDAGSDTIRRIVQQGLWGAAIIVVPMWVVLWYARPIFLALGQDPRLAKAAADYLHALQWAILPALVYLVLRSLFAALGHPRWTVVVGAVAVAINALLNWVFIGGHAGLSALGLFGSGLATVLSNAFMAGALAAIAVLDPRFAHLRTFARFARPDWRGLGAFWRLGLPIGASLMLETGMFAGAAALVGWVDEPSLAAHAIALQVAAFMFMVPLGVAQAATIRIGRAAAAAQIAGVTLAGWTALGLGLATMAMSATLLLAAPNLIIDRFLDAGDPNGGAVRGIAVTLLGLAGLFQIADGAQVVLAGMLRGLRDTRAPMMIAAVGYWGVGLPVGGLLAVGAGLRAPGVWLGLTAGLFTVAVLLLVRWRQMLRRETLLSRRPAE